MGTGDAAMDAKVLALLLQMQETQKAILDRLEKLEETVDTIKDATDTLDEQIQMVDQSIENLALFTSDDMSDNLTEQIGDALKPVLEANKKTLDETMRKLGLFMLRYANDKVVEKVPTTSIEDTHV